MSSFRSRIKAWVPPAAVGMLRRTARRGVYFSGNFQTWQEAQSKAEGYDQGAILDRVLNATREVCQGRAVFERDGALFDQKTPPYALLAAVMRVLATQKPIHILDFGGALGSSFFQCRDWIRGIGSVAWSVVEQANFVEAGRAHIHEDGLHFFKSMKECIASNGAADLILFSGVLQYVPDPWSILSEAVTYGPRMLVIDRTPFHPANSERIRIQHVPTSLGRASYPVRILSESSLLSLLEKEYMNIGSFPALDGMISGAHFKGFIFDRRSQ